MNNCFLPPLARTSWQPARAGRPLALFIWQAALFFVLQAFSLPVLAEAFSSADEKSVHAVVDAQLAALAKDDAKKAFSYAAPNVRKSVGSATGFIALVRKEYPMVYRPASVVFLRTEGKDDEAFQRVQILDADGNSWLAVYSLQRQKNKSWLITGCVVVESRSRMA